MMGDNSKTSIGALVLTGVKIGVCGQLLGMAVEDIPAFTFYSNHKKKSLVEYNINKAIRTQARMMKRRNINQNNFDENNNLKVSHGKKQHIIIKII